MRLRTIDGLRGIAAMAVVLYHANVAVLDSFTNWLPPAIASVLGQGALGVDVFFVLSGFVIPFSVRNAQLNLAFLGRFALRRSVRLDPPYWATIALEVSLIAVGLRLGLADTPLPSIKQTLAHLIYAQNIFGQGDIVAVFWTLCFEIQFYVGLIALFVAGRAIRQRTSVEIAKTMAYVVFAGLFIVSVLGRYELLGVTIHPGFALLRWFQFFMGCCVYWVTAGVVSPRVLYSTWAVLAGVLVVQDQSLLQTAPILTSALLLWSHRKDEMATILSGRTVQFLGAISYSLYLLHATIIWRWTAMAGRILGPDAPLPIVLAVFGSSCALATLISWLAWKYLEKPSMALSKRIELPRVSRAGRGEAQS